MLLSNFDITLPLTFSTKSILVAGAAANQARKLRITNTKLYVPAVTISTQENIKLTRKQNNWNIVLKKQIIGINIIFKKQIKLETENSDILIDTSFQEVNSYKKLKAISSSNC